MNLRPLAFAAVAAPLIFPLRAETEPEPPTAPLLFDSAFFPNELEETRLLAEIIERRRLPITTDGGPVGKRLQEWQRTALRRDSQAIGMTTATAINAGPDDRTGRIATREPAPLPAR